VNALYWFHRVSWNRTFPCDLSKSRTMIYILECYHANGWGATIHDSVLDFHVSRFKVAYVVDFMTPKSRLGGLDYFALWIILQNNWGIQKSSNNCVSSSIPLLNLQKNAPTHTLTQAVQTNLFSQFLAFLPYNAAVLEFSMSWTL
jgi:hypothetical protein